MKIDGKKMYELRERMKVPRADVAKAAGLSHARIWQIETDDVSEINQHIVRAICRKIGCKVSDLKLL